MSSVKQTILLLILHDCCRDFRRRDSGHPAQMCIPRTIYYVDDSPQVTAGRSHNGHKEP